MKNFYITILILPLLLALVIGCAQQKSHSQFILVAHRGGVVDDTTSENSLKGLVNVFSKPLNNF